MNRETSDQSDSKALRHSDSSALTISMADMQSHFKSEKTGNNAASAKLGQFLDMGNADDLYGKSGQDSVQHLSDRHGHGRTKHAAAPEILENCPNLISAKELAEWEKKNPKPVGIDQAFRPAFDRNAPDIDPKFQIPMERTTRHVVKEDGKKEHVGASAKDIDAMLARLH